MCDGLRWLARRVDRHASQAVLVATGAGRRRLNAQLGWQVHAATAIAVMPAGESCRVFWVPVSQLNQR
jgi:hypothetical protein